MHKHHKSGRGHMKMAHLQTESSLLLTTGRQPGALNRANFGSLQPGIANDAANQGQPGMAGNRGTGSPGTAWPGLARPGLAWARASLARPHQARNMAWPNLRMLSSMTHCILRLGPAMSPACQAWPSFAKPGQAWPGLARPGLAWPRQAKPGQASPGEPSWDHGRAKPTEAI